MKSREFWNLKDENMREQEENQMMRMVIIISFAFLFKDKLNLLVVREIGQQISKYEKLKVVGTEVISVKENT